MGGSGTSAGSSHLPRVLVAVVVVLLLGVTACSGPGGDGASSPAAAVDTAGHRCDGDVNTALFNELATPVDHAGPAHVHGSAPGHAPVTFTLAQWAQKFTNPALGMSTNAVLHAVSSDVVYRRHILGGVLAETLGPSPWVPLTDSAACRTLDVELGQVRHVVARFPTVADAVRAGYKQGDHYVAGMGVHYQNWDLLGGFDPAKPVQLLYDGTEPGSHLVGVSYVVKGRGSRPPAGFPGDNDQWHLHGKYCLKDVDGVLINLATDVLSKAECAARGGTELANQGGWMLHVWAVPGCENDWGIFSPVNPRIPYLPPGVRLDVGCRAPHTN
jgi:hypothetical protein